MEEKKYVIIAAGGFGTRMNSEVPKQFLQLAGIPVIVHTIQAFTNTWREAEIIVVLPEEELARWEKIRKKFLKKSDIRTTKGGATRFHSVKNGLKLIKEDGFVAIHDACRPFATPRLLRKCFQVTQENGNAIPAVELKESIREVRKSGSQRRDRSRYKMIQTPQCFKVSQLKAAYQQTFRKDFTDDASVAEAAGMRICLVEGEACNFKITTPLDLSVAEKVSARKK